MAKYKCNSNYYGGNNALFEHNLTSDGKIDFSTPPAGYRYTAMRLEGDTAKDLHLDPMFITMHSFGGPVKFLCYMELAEEKLSAKLEQPDKTEVNKNIRESRCRIRSPKTGKLIMCPADGAHNCAICTLEEHEKFFPARPLSLEALTYSDDESEEKEVELPAPDDTEAEFFEDETRSMIRAELAEMDTAKKKKGQRAMNLAIYNLWMQGYEFMEISEALGIKKATLHDDLVRIAMVVQKYVV